MNENLMASDDWVPASCTLPTIEQPLRRAEFDDLFAHDIVNITRTSASRVQFELRADPEVAARAARLAAKETGCCSFFTFYLTITDGRIDMAISTEAAHETVLAALAGRAESTIKASA